MKVEVLGTGCANCRQTLALIEQVAQERALPIDLVKIEDLPTIIRYGVMATPGVVVDGQVVHAGGVPQRAKVEQWLTGAASTPTSAGTGKCCG